MRLFAALTLTVLVTSGMLLLHVMRDPLAVERWRGRWALTRAGATWLTDTTGLVRQREAFDCGPAALAMLLRLRGYRVPPPDVLLALSGTTRRGTSLRRLAAASTGLGAAATVTRVSSSGQLGPLPLLALMSSRHFVVLERRQAHGVIVVLDPQLGKYAIPEAALRRQWSGLALAVAANAPAKARPWRSVAARAPP